jgi:hypothetical protein
MKKQPKVGLPKQDQQELRHLLQRGLQPVRTVLRALALRQLDEGQTVRQVAKNVALTPKTIYGALHPQARKLVEPGRNRDQLVLAAVPGPPPDRRSSVSADRNSGLEPSYEPPFYPDSMELYPHQSSEDI